MSPTIVLLHDAYAAPGRVDVSDTLLEAQAIATTLNELGYESRIVSATLDLGDLERTLRALVPYAVINLVESLDGRGELIHVVPALLESLHLPYTGCSANALRCTSHKLRAKQQLARAGIPTPAVHGDETTEQGPWIVKSVWEHASLGIDDSSVVHDPAAVAPLLVARRAEFGGDWFAERFVAGRELNVALIREPQGVRALPVAELRFEGFPADKPAIVGYAAKWHTDSFEYRHTVRRFGIEAELAARVAGLARECWELFDLNGYARVDFRVTGSGAPSVLEVNANPSLSPDAGFAAALAADGVAYSTAVRWLVEDALARAGDSSVGDTRD
jgi:D-alanine-D-alanine ligase